MLGHREQHYVKVRHAVRGLYISSQTDEKPDKSVTLLPILCHTTTKDIYSVVSNIFRTGRVRKKCISPVAPITFHLSRLFKIWQAIERHIHI